METAYASEGLSVKHLLDCRVKALAICRTAKLMTVGAVMLVPATASNSLNGSYEENGAAKRKKRSRWR